MICVKFFVLAVFALLVFRAPCGPVFLKEIAMNTRSSRRHFVASGLALSAVAAAPAGAQSLILKPAQEALPRSGKRRVVIAGGGWGGLTAARYVRQLVPDLEVIVLDRNPFFWSCPMSNKWLIDVVNTDFLAHSYLPAAKKYGYHFIQTEIGDIDRASKRVYTSQGFVSYDWLILAGGIRNNYEAWFGNDWKTVEYTQKAFPSAYIPTAEHAVLKNKIQNFKGGTIVMTLPPPPHRCPPSPYERACLMAWWFKTKKIAARIVILDPKPRIAPITAGYRAAFEELYPDIVTHVPNARVKSVDPYKKRISTEAGDFDFDEAIFMPPHQASDLVWKADLIGKTPEGKPTGWAAVDPLIYNAKGDPQVFVIGDSVGAISPQFGHYPKSGHVANWMGKSVAQHIANQAAGKEPKHIMLDNLCYMLVNNDPKQAISVQFDYKFGPEGHIIQTQIDDNDRRSYLWEEDMRWITRMFSDFVVA